MIKGLGSVNKDKPSLRITSLVTQNMLRRVENVSMVSIDWTAYQVNNRHYVFLTSWKIVRKPKSAIAIMQNVFCSVKAEYL